MGYDAKQAKNALKNSKNDIDAALDYIKEEEINGDLPELKKHTSFTNTLDYTGNQFIRMMLFICDELAKSTKKCLICLDNLDAPSIKLRTCEKESCEFTFEESFSGSLLTELKYYTHEAQLDISIASKAVYSSRGAQIFEPFPTFCLKGFEIRDKRGNLDAIKKAQQAGTDVGKAKKTNELNKDMKMITDIYTQIPQLRQLTQDVETEEDLRKRLIEVFHNDQKKGFSAYKLLRYILATNRSTVRYLKADERVRLPEGTSDMFEQYILISQDPKKERKFM